MLCVKQCPVDLPVHLRIIMRELTGIRILCHVVTLNPTRKCSNPL